MSYDLTGTLEKKFDTEQKTEKFSTREFVVRVEGSKPEYPEFIKFQMVNDRCELIDNIREGTEVKVSFNLRGREWQGKYFTNLEAWKVQPEGAAPPKQKQSPPEPTDDLPF